ncbi:superoxide dismutase family protein [Usitatibacter palustris]|uniref:Superoxide dismutase [Cu-Zn] n=1 Tax=Usitatibacter palustris TaxID=2732487 RepID=A0A6M4H7N1_9PROT|nr:superoxide dismutase family protein [Usitatibacter palustris]QJR15570.1 Superoxide dismutase-like protein YojM [Usitatibacter palustris]
MIRLTFGLFAATALVAGCAHMSQPEPDGPMATANLKATKGNSANGYVVFQQKGDKVLVSGTVSGLKANAEHGFHVHEKGDCSAPDGMSTGGHFNPGGKPHGHAGERHVGDMANLKADEHGNATVSYTSDLMKVGSGENDIVGRGLIVHANPDDYKTQPTGNAGGRIACAVITKAP